VVGGGGGVVVGAGFLSSIAVIFSFSSSFVSSSPFSMSSSTSALAMGVRSSSLTLLLSSALSINTMTSTKLFPPVLSSSTLRGTSPTFKLRESADREGIYTQADVLGDGQRFEDDAHGFGQDEFYEWRRGRCEWCDRGGVFYIVSSFYI